MRSLKNLHKRDICVGVFDGLVEGIWLTVGKGGEVARENCGTSTRRERG